MEVLGSEHVYTSPWLAVREDAVRHEDGADGTYVVVEGPDVALTIPIEGGHVQLVEQYRHCVGGRRWEFPSGSVETGRDADPAAVAERELREETGLTVSTLTKLGTLELSPSTLNQRCSVFLATDLTQGEPRRDAEEQDMRTAWFTRSEVERMIATGRICDSKSVAAYTLLLLDERGTHA